ncbi:MAG: hypothetical protein Kow00124_13340 [Anaerolineae bacterium]
MLTADLPARLDQLAAAAKWEYLLYIAAFFLAAWVIHRLAGRLANRLVRLTRLASRQGRLKQERQQTLRGLFAGLISFFVFAFATLFSLALFVDAATLIWMVGLFSAAFGLGARPLVSDFLSGVSFIFEDTFDVGEKVEIVGAPGGTIEGVIEEVYLRTTLVRAPTGELFTVPNGEIRVVRNFSRGRFSRADIKLKVAADDLSRAVALLSALGVEAVNLLPNLLEPWQVIGADSAMGQETELTLIAKARFGKAAEMRPNMLALIQERLTEAGITLL